MEQKKFEAILVLIVPKVIDLIREETGVNEVEAANNFYASGVYSLLEQEETKLWHLSPLTLYHMYEEEKRTGNITFPEG